MDDINRLDEGEEVSMPLRVQVDVDVECALVTQLEEQGGLMPTEEVVGSFFNEPYLEPDYERVCPWRNWRITHIERA